MNDSTTQLQTLKDSVVSFREDRNWGKHHTPKNLAISIAIEAAELMELFQWDDYSKRDQEKIQDELADVIIYCLNMADVCDIDIASAVTSKLKKAAMKYLSGTFNKDNDNPDTYHEIKQSYRKNKH